jgi:heat shock protein HslJ
MFRKMTRLLILTLTLFVASCSQKNSQLKNDLEAHDWELTRLTINKVDEDLTVLDRKISLYFDGSRVYGHAGVNHYDGTASVNKPNQISLPGFGMTEMAGPKYLMDLDDTYMKALTGATTATVTGSTLVLESSNARLEYSGRPALPRKRGDPSQTVTNTAP